MDIPLSQFTPPHPRALSKVFHFFSHELPEESLGSAWVFPSHVKFSICFVILSPPDLLISPGHSWAEQVGIACFLGLCLPFNLHT